MNTSKKRRWLYLAAVALLGAIALTYVLINRYRDADASAPRSFDGRSTSLTNTVVVPTLDTPLPEGRSAIWCGSFQLAWNELRTNVVKEPIEFVVDEPAAQRLNEAAFSQADLAAESHYAVAGLADDGIADRIRSDMQQRFPRVRVPDLGADEGAIAYAYLQASLKFPVPYFESQLRFQDSSGKTTAVSAFGIREKEESSVKHLRDQVAVLFVRYKDDEVSEFALDLCKDSTPHQIVVARVEGKATLAQTVAAVNDRIAKGKETRSKGHGTSFGINDRFLVPTMLWRIEHRFAELEHKKLRNAAIAGMYIDRAFQFVDFRLDKAGVQLESQAHGIIKEGPRTFYFDRPYLIVLRKRGAEHPFFVMWVENAELMSPG